MPKIDQIKKIVLFTILLFILVVLLYALLIEPNRIEVSHVDIKDTALARTLKGKTAVHVSDLHITQMGKREKEILKIIDDLKPDILFLTGDYVKWKGTYEGALGFLSRLDAPMGVWAVMGDYDYSSSRKSCLFCHEPGSGEPTTQHRVRFLRNAIAQAAFPNGDACLGGIDPESSLNDVSGMPASFMKDKTPAIILSHSPLIFDSIDKDHDVLILAGDTHGGQVPIPARFWRLVGYKKNAHYNHGFFQEGHKKMYVSRGIGTSHFPFRFLRAPELVVLHF